MKNTIIAQRREGAKKEFMVVQEPQSIQRILEAVKNVFGDDRKRIDHALSVFRHAQELLRSEEGDEEIVLAAALLHDIGIHEAERKYGSSAGHYQEIEGPPIAEGIMADIGLDKPVIDHVSLIIANHHTGKNIDTPEFRIIWDADWLVNIPDEFPELDREKLQRTIERLFRTETGKKRAYSLYIDNETDNSRYLKDNDPNHSISLPLQSKNAGFQVMLFPGFRKPS